MPVVINGSGTVTGISAGGLPDGIIQSADLATGVGGKILQVVSSTKQDAWSYTANTTAAVDVTGTDQSGSGSVFCVKITPAATSSKILFTCNFCLGMGGGAAYVQGFMMRGSTTLLPGTHGTGNSVNCTFGRSGTGSSYYVENVGFTLLDSPNSTSELTYKVQFGKGDGSYEVYVNRPATLDNQPYNTLGSSTLTVMEVAA
jgi:hypothetical protein